MRPVVTSLLLILLLQEPGFAQPKPKEIKAVRTTESIRIDGKLLEAAWKETTPATEFIEYRPNYGALEKHTNRSEIFLLYDNTSIYVAGYLHETTRDSIS